MLKEQCNYIKDFQLFQTFDLEFKFKNFYGCFNRENYNLKQIVEIKCIFIPILFALMHINAVIQKQFISVEI